MPYGEEYGPQIGTNHYKFTGKERDSETGLDYFGARYYGSALGRWLTPDWAAKATAVPYAEFADPQSLNLYTYVRNIPTTRIDADGHCPDACVIEGAIVVAIGEVLKDLGIMGIGVGLGWLSDHIPSPTPRGHNHGNNSRLGGRGGHGKTGTAKALPAPKSNPAPGAQAGTQPKDVYLDPNKYPASAGHADAAQKAGHPDVVTVDHDKAAAAGRRSDALQGTKTQPGTDRDEYPPASTKEGGAGSSVQNIPSSDNRGWGGSWGQQTKDVPSGSQVKINIRPKPED